MTRLVLRLLAAPLLVATSIANAGPPQVSIRQAGVGNVLPIGQPTGIEVLVDPGDLAPATYILEWESTTPDGDALLYQRRIPLAGSPVRTWIHGQVPRHLKRDMPIRLRHADDLTVLASTDVITRTSTSLVLPEGAELILVIGQSRRGLEGYEAGSPNTPPAWSHTPNTVRTIAVEDLPDRPAGLAAVSTLLWTGDTAELDSTRATVLRDWMEAGGHLIISLPDIGDPWQLGQPGGLWQDILPANPTRTDLRPEFMATLLSPDALVPMDETRMPAQVFGPTIGIDTPWHTVLTLPDGQPVVIARPVGFGRLTLIGIDVTSQALMRYRIKRTPAGLLPTGTLPSAAVFWNPILARRGDAPTPTQNRVAMDRGELIGMPPHFVEFTDQVVAHGIQQTIAAGGRLLFVLGWLALCWLVGGPLLWRFLGRWNRRSWTWPAFTVLAAIGALFAAAAGGLMSLSSAEGRHFTLLEQIAGTPRHHVRSWVNLRLPGTQQHILSVERQPNEQPRLGHWIESNQSTIHFADTRTLIANTETPEQLPVQARSTAVGLTIDWLGVLNPEDWGGVLWVVDPVRPTPADSPGSPLQGVLQSALPATLRDISIIWVEARTEPDPTQPDAWADPAKAGHMPTRVWWWKLTSEVPPEGQIGLSQLPPRSSANLLSTQIHDILKNHERRFGIGQFTKRRGRIAAELLGLYRLITPPQWQADNVKVVADWVIASREFGTELEFGAALGTPMLIVTGFLDESDLPIPLSIDGDPMHAPQGEVMVRWILPLPDAEPVEAHGITR
jgi:hypothetical protein